jgi:hypothetical protein
VKLSKTGFVLGRRSEVAHDRPGANIHPPFESLGENDDNMWFL